jgi:hypothetical protein
MGTVSNNASQIASVRTVTSINYIKKTYNLPQEESNSFDKHFSPDEKSLIVSNKQSNSSNSASFNYQYQQNVPVSLLSTSSQPYNEVAKPFVTAENSPVKEEPETAYYSVEDSSGKSQKTGLGYYLVDKSIIPASGRKTSQKAANPMRDRMNKIYNLNFSIDPGTIVNVTCF